MAGVGTLIVLGYLDDLVLVLRRIPAPVRADCRAQAQARMSEGRPASWAAAAVIVAIWLVAAGLLVLGAAPAAWLMLQSLVHQAA